MQAPTHSTVALSCVCIGAALASAPISVAYVCTSVVLMVACSLPFQPGYKSSSCTPLSSRHSIPRCASLDCYAPRRFVSPSGAHTTVPLRVPERWPYSGNVPHPLRGEVETLSDYHPHSGCARNGLTGFNRTRKRSCPEGILSLSASTPYSGGRQRGRSALYRRDPIRPLSEASVAGEKTTDDSPVGGRGAGHSLASSVVAPLFLLPHFRCLCPSSTSQFLRNLTMALSSPTSASRRRRNCEVDERPLAVRY
jgi:hypothetical protein